MSFASWSRSEIEQGRKIVSSGLRGARSGEQEFLNGASLNGFVGDTIRTACRPAALGACIGAVAGCSARTAKSTRRAVVFGLAGAAIGFGAGIAWKSRHLTASAVRGASRNIRTVRDERWMRKNSIAYA